MAVLKPQHKTSTELRLITYLPHLPLEANDEKGASISKMRLLMWMFAHVLTTDVFCCLMTVWRRRRMVMIVGRPCLASQFLLEAGKLPIGAYSFTHL